MSANRSQRTSSAAVVKGLKTCHTIFFNSSFNGNMWIRNSRGASKECSTGIARLLERPLRVLSWVRVHATYLQLLYDRCWSRRQFYAGGVHDWTVPFPLRPPEVHPLRQRCRRPVVRPDPPRAAQGVVRRSLLRTENIFVCCCCVGSDRAAGGRERELHHGCARKMVSLTSAGDPPLPPPYHRGVWPLLRP